MLILSRKSGQEIVLLDGQEVVATVVIHKIKGSRVHVGIRALDRIRAVRAELPKDDERWTK